MTHVWIIGGGLLGSALRTELLEQKDYFLFEAPSFPWNDTEKFTSQIKSAARSFAAEVIKNNTDWMIFWTAGRGSIGSNEHDMKAETVLLTSALSAIGSEPGLKQHAGKFFFASSAGGIYAASVDEVITEVSLPMPTSAYGKEKLVQESLVSDWAKTMPNASALIARISNLYGPNQSKGKQQGLISHIARCVLLHKTVNVYVPLDTIRDYLHVRDAAQLILASMQLMPGGSVVTKIIAAEEPTTIAQIVGIFRHITRSMPRIITSGSVLGSHYPHRMSFRSTVLLDASKTRTGILQGIAEILEYERRSLAAGNA